MIESLIDKKDGFEIVRDQIAAILRVEVENQKALAEASGKDPGLWDLRIFSERSNPFEEIREGESTPLVNVWYSSSEFDYASSGVVDRQAASGVFNIDVYGTGTSQETEEGHSPGDMLAAETTHRAVRLVRNILMSGRYTYLGLRGLVGRRSVQNITIFQPEATDDMAQQIVGARLSFRVVFNESSPQVEPVILEGLLVKVKRAENGEILINLEYKRDGD